MLVCAAAPRAAAADWLVTPFFGVKFDGQTSLFDPDNGAKKSSMATGSSVMLIGEGPLGVEADFGYFPGAFGSKSTLVAGSRALTLTGNVILAMPTQVTRESLRPFVLAGIGWMQARVHGVLFESSLDETALDLGGGVIGTLTRRTSVRFEIRRFQNITTHDAAASTGSIGRTKLHFWRADAGLAFKF